MFQRNLKEFIKETELLTKEQIEEVEEIIFKENISFLDALLKLDFLDQKTLSKIASHLTGVPQINLQKIDDVDLKIYKTIPPVISFDNNIIAFEKIQNTISVAFSDIKNLEIVERLFADLPYEYKLYFASQEDILKHKNLYKKEVVKNLYDDFTENLTKMKKLENYAFNTDKDMPDHFLQDFLMDPYVNNFIEDLLIYAVFSKASFVYINNNGEKVKISYRIFGKNYTILETDVSSNFGILTKLKYLADLNVSAKDAIVESSFVQKIFDKDYNFNLVIVQNDFGQSATIEIKEFSEDFKIFDTNLTKRQNELFIHSIEKNNGVILLLGSPEIARKKILYTLLEKEAKRDKEVFSIETTLLKQISYVKQISLLSYKNLNSILTKILSSKPDTVAIEEINRSSLSTILKYANFDKKIILNLKGVSKDFIDRLFVLNLQKGYIVKNFSVLINTETFSQLEEEKRKKYKLSKSEIKIITKYLSDKEIEELFIREGMQKQISRTWKKANFYTKTKKTSILSLMKDKTEKIDIKSVFDLAVLFEEIFLHKLDTVSSANKIRFEIKKTMLENLLIASARGIVDIKEVFIYLTK